MDIDALKRLVNNAIDQWAAGVSPTTPSEHAEVANNTEVDTAGTRVVRTKSTGDRVYFLNDEKKTRQWVTNEEILGKLGFGMDDVVEIEDGELLKYNMASAIYKVDES